MVGERSRTMVGELVEPWWASKRGACDFSSFMNMDELFSALPFCSLANSAEHASAPRALQGFGFRLHCLAATACGGPSNPAYVARENPSMDFLGIAEALRTSACAKPPSVARY